jgi:hypothetical protein
MLLMRNLYLSYASRFGFSKEPGNCPKCGMKLIEVVHEQHQMTHIPVLCILKSCETNLELPYLRNDFSQTDKQAVESHSIEHLLRSG